MLTTPFRTTLIGDALEKRNDGFGEVLTHLSSTSSHIFFKFEVPLSSDLHLSSQTSAATNVVTVDGGRRTVDGEEHEQEFEG